MKSNQPSGKMDTGLASLVMLVRYHPVAADFPATLKYKHFLRDVIIASCFIQLFGLIVSSIFDVLLIGLRNYVFTHTTNRMDVTPGSRLFNHLTHLPTTYFMSRQVGKTVAGCASWTPYETSLPVRRDRPRVTCPLKDAIQDEKPGLDYKSRLTHGKSDLAITNKLINRSPGMTVTAEAFKGR